MVHGGASRTILNYFLASLSHLRHTLSMKETTPDKPKPRDGVWTGNGLEAEFRYIREHPHSDKLVWIETVSGEHWAPTTELKWDIK